jgi:hypothetical protein
MEMAAVTVAIMMNLRNLSRSHQHLYAHPTGDKSRWCPNDRSLLSAYIHHCFYQAMQIFVC